MSAKTTEIKRELLTQIVNMYGNKPKNFVVKKAKDKGIYSYESSDEEIYGLIERFALHHNLPFGYFPKEEIRKDNVFSFQIDFELGIEKPNEPEIDAFYESLIKQRDSLSKKLLALNRLIETYKT